MGTLEHMHQPNRSAAMPKRAPQQNLGQDNAEPEQPFFLSSKQAFVWATETMRRMRFPGNSSFYRQITQDSFQETLKALKNTALSPTQSLPSSKDEAALLAYDIYRIAVEVLPEKDLNLLRHLYWGDYVTIASYEKARLHQEKARKNGVRVRMAFQRSFSDLARAHEVSASTIKRQHDKALQTLGKGLVQANILA